jgi:hypothetical protein
MHVIGTLGVEHKLSCLFYIAAQADFHALRPHSAITRQDHFCKYMMNRPTRIMPKAT